MELIWGIDGLRSAEPGCVITIGNFDGVHLGHQAMLRKLSDMAAPERLPLVLMTFEPQPQEFFRGEAAPARVTRLREKLDVLSSLSVARVHCLRFDQHLARMSPGVFVEELLHRQLGARAVMVGDDFRFGHHRRGDVDFLRTAGRRHGFEVARMATWQVGGARVSSTRVREALARGDVTGVMGLLGRRYALCGRVIRGERIGRQLGFPTANIALRRRRLPLSGIFAAEVSGLGRQALRGVANVGVRPTLGGTRGLLEVHLLDFDGDLYGRLVRVTFLHKFRDEARFESLEALRVQIGRDIEAAREYFGIE